ncbi:MAG: hypothetical protein ACI4WR_05035 [Bulleidia sp.]
MVEDQFGGQCRATGIAGSVIPVSILEIARHPLIEIDPLFILLEIHIAEQFLGIGIILTDRIEFIDVRIDLHDAIDEIAMGSDSRDVPGTNDVLNAGTRASFLTSCQWR